MGAGGKRLGGASRTSCAPHGGRAPCHVRGSRTGRARLTRQPLPGTAEWGRDPPRGGGGWISTGAAGARAARRRRRGRRRAGSEGRHRCQRRPPWPSVAQLTVAAAPAVGGVPSTTLKPGIRVRAVGAYPFPLEADGAGAALRPLAMAAMAAVCCDAAAFAVAVSVTVAAVCAVPPPRPPRVRLVFLFLYARSGSLFRHPCRCRLDDPG